MRTYEIYYKGYDVFVRKSLGILTFLRTFRSEYNEIYVIDLAMYSCLSALIVFLQSLHASKGNVGVLLISRRKSHLPSLTGFCIGLHDPVPAWYQRLQSGGIPIAEVIDGCKKTRSMKTLSIKSRLILRQFATGYNIGEMTEQLEATEKGIRALLWRLCYCWGFNSTYKLITYIQAEYHYPMQKLEHLTPEGRDDSPQPMTKQDVVICY